MNARRVFLISGWAHGIEALTPLAEALQDICYVVPTSLYELLQEDVKQDPALYADISPYARAVVNRLRESDEPVILMGWSTGGMVAIEAAVAFPENVGGLVLLGTTPHYCSEDDYPFGVPRTVLRALRRGLSRDPQAVLGDFFSRASLPELISEEELHSKVDQALGFGVDPLLHGLDYLQHADFRAALQSIAQPSLIIHGIEDQIVPWRAAEFLNRQIPRSASVILPDAGHMLVEQCTDQVIHHIRTFLENLP